MFHRILYFGFLLFCASNDSSLYAMGTEECGQLPSEGLGSKSGVFVKKVAQKNGLSHEKRKRKRGSEDELMCVNTVVVPCRDVLTEISNVIGCGSQVCVVGQDHGDVRGCVIAPNDESSAQLLCAENALEIDAMSIVGEPAAKKACTHYGEQDTDTLLDAQRMSGAAQDCFFMQWYVQCLKVFSKKKLVKLDKKGVDLAELPDVNRRGVRWSVLAKEIETFDTTMSDIFNEALWLHGQSNVSKGSWFPGELSTSADDANLSYIQKLVVAPGSTILFHGDVHGDIHSINNFLLESIEKGYLGADFKITAPNCYFVFLGDYVDRGVNGTEVLYIILKLKNENPDNVFLVRGNHENITSNMNSMDTGGGFVDELERKFPGITERHIEHIFNIYNKMPLALFIGCEGPDGIIDYVQCCHGGLEMRLDPKLLLNLPGDVVYARLDQLYDNLWKGMRKDFIGEKDWKVFDAHCSCSIGDNETANGLMWNDFMVNDKAQAFKTSVRGDDCFEFGRDMTRKYLEAISGPNEFIVHGIIRGHQHGDLDMINLILQRGKSGFASCDKGVGKLWLSTDSDKQAGKLWSGIVCTLMVSPDGGFGQRYNYTQDYYATLTIDSGFDTWRLKIADANI